MVTVSQRANPPEARRGVETVGTQTFLQLGTHKEPTPQTQSGTLWAARTQSWSPWASAWRPQAGRSAAPSAPHTSGAGSPRSRCWSTGHRKSPLLLRPGPFAMPQLVGSKPSPPLPRALVPHRGPEPPSRAPPSILAWSADGTCQLRGTGHCPLSRPWLPKSCAGAAGPLVASATGQSSLHRVMLAPPCSKSRKGR